MHEIKKYLAVWQNKRFMMVVVAFLALSGVALGSRIPMITSLIEEGINGPELTIIARADGTLDIKEFAIQNQWFAPDVIGAGLKITAVRRFGRDVKLGNVSVMVQADPGVKDETIRTALISIGQSGFHRVGFTDPRLVEIARQVATSPLPKPLAPAQGGTVASARRR